MDDDAILDTDHQMQAEPFAPQIFSPTKTALSGTTAGRKAKSDATVPKIRGGIGVVIRKAVRRSNRDLTLLRSHGQHLLPQQTSHSSPTGTIGAVESIQDRAFIVLRLKQRHENVPHFASYEAYIQEVGAKLKGSTADKIKDQNSVVVEALFQPQVAEYLKLCPGKLVRIYEPLHFVTEQRAVGSTSKPKWFLLSTQLAEQKVERWNRNIGK
ncbi:unnamed protein product [Phytophthora lilii]|uniref:Unnamed protein product n=1 Tax=Phytophthora lilii TaxID=2077276 RepID=A0A9W6U1K8_9STRA|nr:unnamed protein product [Phytophthora lilii]